MELLYVGALHTILPVTFNGSIQARKRPNLSVIIFMRCETIFIIPELQPKIQYS